MSEAPIFSAEQIQVPKQLPGLMKALTKFVIRCQADAEEELSYPELLKICAE